MERSAIPRPPLAGRCTAGEPPDCCREARTRALRQQARPLQICRTFCSTRPPRHHRCFALRRSARATRLALLALLKPSVAHTGTVGSGRFHDRGRFRARWRASQRGEVASRPRGRRGRFDLRRRCQEAFDRRLLSPIASPRTRLWAGARMKTRPPVSRPRRRRSRSRVAPLAQGPRPEKQRVRVVAHAQPHANGLSCATGAFHAGSE
jgi:hypothetical protein